MNYIDTQLVASFGFEDFLDKYDAMRELGWERIEAVHHQLYEVTMGMKGDTTVQLPTPTHAAVCIDDMAKDPANPEHIVGKPNAVKEPIKDIPKPNKAQYRQHAKK